jgi:uncharacterized membrane protein
MTVDEALKYIISMGVVAPRAPNRPRAGTTPGPVPAPSARPAPEIRN